MLFIKYTKRPEINSGLKCSFKDRNAKVSDTRGDAIKNKCSFHNKSHK